MTFKILYYVKYVYTFCLWVTTTHFYRVREAEYLTLLILVNSVVRLQTAETPVSWPEEEQWSTALPSAGISRLIFFFSPQSLNLNAF